MIYSREEANIFRQWFNAVFDLNEAYLSLSDYKLAAKIHLDLGQSVPNDIMKRVLEK